MGMHNHSERRVAQHCIHLQKAKCQHPEGLAFGRLPKNADCVACPHYQGPSRGVGDIVANITKSIGFRPCGGCQKRREALNRAIPLAQPPEILGDPEE